MRRPGSALLRGRYGDDLHPFHCLLLDLLTAGSPEEGEKAALLPAFALPFLLRCGAGEWDARRAEALPRGAERPYFWTAAIRSA